MLIARVEAMLGKVRRVRVVKEIIEWSNDRILIKGRKSEVAGGIERCVDTDRYERS